MNVVEIQNIVPLTPTNSSTLTFVKTEPQVDFSWSGNSYASKYKVTVYSSPDMSNIIEEKEVKTTSCRISLSKDGTYYWTVTPFYTIGDTGYLDSSDLREFSVQTKDSISAPELSFPKENEEFVYKDDFSTMFIWNSDIPKAEHTLLISQDASFSNIIFRKAVNSTKLLVDFADLSLDKTASTLKEGSYYWMVIRSSGDTDDTSPDSGVRSFRVSHDIDRGTVLVSPKENFISEESDLDSEEFVWNYPASYTGEGRAVMQVSKTSNFEAIAFQKETSGQSVSHVSLPYGSYYWRVGIKKPDGSISNLSEERALSVLRPLTAVKFISPTASESVLTEGGSIAVRWQEVGGADFYSVKLSDSEGNVLYDIKENALPGASFNLQTGSYVCSVRAMTRARGELSERSGGESSLPFSVSRLERVELLSPAQNFVMGTSYFIENRTLVFTWKAVSGSTAYDFSLYKRGADGTYTEINKQTVRGESRAVIGDLSLLSSGSFRWTVKALRYNSDGVLEQESGAESRNFSIALETPSAVRVKDPGKLYGD